MTLWPCPRVSVGGPHRWQAFPFATVCTLPCDDVGVNIAFGAQLTLVGTATVYVAYLSQTDFGAS